VAGPMKCISLRTQAGGHNGLVLCFSVFRAFFFVTGWTHQERIAAYVVRLPRFSSACFLLGFCSIWLLEQTQK
jgi:hypothetical protein